MKSMCISTAKRVLAVLVPVVAFAGCAGGKSEVAVSGRLVEDGKPIAVSTEGLPPGTRPIQITFHALSQPGGSSGESFHCSVNTETGDFTVNGPSSKGIPPGKYRISVAVLSLPSGGASRGANPSAPGAGGANSMGMMGMSDKLKGAFSQERSRLEVEITRPTQIVIDVGSKPGVSVQ